MAVSQATEALVVADSTAGEARGVCRSGVAEDIGRVDRIVEEVTLWLSDKPQKLWWWQIQQQVR